MSCLIVDFVILFRIALRFWSGVESGVHISIRNPPVDEITAFAPNLLGGIVFCKGLEYGRDFDVEWLP